MNAVTVPEGRVEGAAKVTGTGVYTGDLDPAGAGERLLHAVIVQGAQATGRIAAIDDAAALALPGVVVMTHRNAPRLGKVMALMSTEIGDMLPLQDDRLRYDGQCVALVLADDAEVAREAAARVRIAYADADPAAAYTLDRAGDRLVPAKKVGAGDPGHERRGDPEAAFAAAPLQVDIACDTAAHHHNPIEPGAALARWDADGRLTVHVPTQFTYGDAIALAQAFGLPLKDRLPRLVLSALGGVQLDSRVRLVSPLIGGGFGNKGGSPTMLLAAMAAKLTGRPVKLVVTRRQAFFIHPYRGATHQRLRLGADADGRLRAILHDIDVQAATTGSFIEPAAEATDKLYACDAVEYRHRVARLDVNAPGWMRAPGVAVGVFALETAMDELAHAAGTDPLDLRLVNYAETEPDSGKPWSSKALRECYAAAAERIGWHARDRAIGARDDAGRLVGYGMATSIYRTNQFPASARITIGGDGVATVDSASSEMGQGNLTAMTRIAADALGLPMAQVRFRNGDTALPYGSMTAASSSTLSVGAAIHDAATKAVRAIARRAARDPASPLHRRKAADIRVIDGMVTAGDAAEPLAALMARHPGASIAVRAIAGRSFGRSRYGRAAFGCQFARVSVDPDTLELRVEQLVGAFAGGRIVAPTLARSQLIGGMVWGLGQALMEETHRDRHTGRWMTANLAESLVPVHADMPGIEVMIVDEDDRRGHPLGVKGLGEIGGVGTAAAIANAVFHATGTRIRSLPITIDKLMAEQTKGGTAR